MLCCVIRLVQLLEESFHRFINIQQWCRVIMAVFRGGPCCAHLTVHESLKLQLSNAKLAVLLGQTPSGLSKVDLSSPHHTHILRRLTQLQLVCPLQLEVLKAPETKRRCLFLSHDPYLQWRKWGCADVRPDENVELFTLHLHVVLLLV